jgi:hypothetical protein
MADKAVAKDVIDALPDGATMDEIMHALYVRAKFEHGEREIREGKGVHHTKARERLRKWLR